MYLCCHLSWLELDENQVNGGATISQPGGGRSGRGTGGRRPADLETPLYDAVDPDELDTLLEGANRGGRSPVEVTLRYNGYMVTVDGDLTVTITE
ncbi:HalOD1 output domain-containing protein [Halomicroarcula sp. GCM10025894]|uniref:HalOD1 output domain-containing protein n=1 Tax=Halomicroarcula sp. GCM10025894 TaxID=3252673 RepID=UPI00361B7794